MPNITFDNSTPDPTGWILRGVDFFTKEGKVFNYTSKQTCRKSGTIETSENKIIPYSMTFTEHVGSKSFRLKDLPTSQPSEPNCVWKDDKGYLRIT